MKRFIIVFSVVAGLIPLRAQVAEMNWELDYQIFLKMGNDSNYTYDISELFHITDAKNIEFSSEFVFYPVNPGQNFSEEMKSSEPDKESYSTLWSALHAKLGGGWIHFANCIVYALETQRLDLKEPIMKRPETDWKPDPVTESWKRTHKWDYYVPVSQKNAIKEFKIKDKENTLGDLKNLPESYSEQFLSTSDKEYASLFDAQEFNELARLDLVKVILGANYLGEHQVNYMSNAVLTAVRDYTASILPSVLIFDEFNAAAAMSLDAEGYEIESIVFKASANLSDSEIRERQEEIIRIINAINRYNKDAFQKRLDNYYGK